MWKKSSALLIGLTLLMAGASTVFASGFALIEQSVSGLGNAFAGGSAIAEDATTVFFNPAGMTRIEGQQAIGALHIIVPSAKFNATAAENSSNVAIPGGNGGDGGVVGVAPNTYYVNKLNDRLAVGIGINAPFGLATKYDKDWIGRYHAVESDVLTININPSIAYKVSEQLSIGAGFNAQYIEAILSSMVDGRALAASPASNPMFDIFVENEADDWSYGYNLGLLYEFNDSTRLGFAYRSEIKHKLKGTTTAQLPAAFAAAPAAQALFPATQGVYGNITLPASASLSFFHQLNENLAIMADVSWTEWSSFKELTLNFEGAGIGGSSFTTTPENWDDTWRYSVGASYQHSENLQLRCGIAFDETPIPDPEHRTPRIPGEDRFWIALGAGYGFSENLILDFAYAHLFVPDGDINKTLAETPTAGSLVGSFENQVDIVSAQLTYKF